MEEERNDLNKNAILEFLIPDESMYDLLFSLIPFEFKTSNNEFNKIFF